MSEAYVRNRILEIQRRLSSSEIKSANQAMKDFITEGANWTPDDELIFWQIYSRKKVQCRSWIVAIYLYFTTITLLFISDCDIWWLYVKVNIGQIIAIWMLLPLLISITYWIIKNFFLQKENGLALKILDAHFQDLLYTEINEIERK